MLTENLTGVRTLANPGRPGSPPPELLNWEYKTKRQIREWHAGAKFIPPKCHPVNCTLQRLNSRGRLFLGGYRESTILPGAVPVENGEPVIAVGAPVDGL